MRVLTIAIAIALGGCVVSPQPSPPPVISLNEGGVAFGATAEFVDDATALIGAPGTVDPPQGKLVVTNLSNTTLPSEALIQPDGSFELRIAALPSDVLRLQVVDGTARSPVVDLVQNGTGVLPPAHPLAGCLAIDSENFETLGRGETTPIGLRNNCPGTVVFSAPKLRRNAGGFTVLDPSAFDLAPGAAKAIRVLRENTDAPEVEDVLILETTNDRIWITFATD